MTEEEQKAAEEAARLKAAAEAVLKERLLRLGEGYKIKSVRIISAANPEDGRVVHLTEDEQADMTARLLGLLQARIQAP